MSVFGRFVLSVFASLSTGETTERSPDVCLCLVDLSYLCSPISTGETTERSPDVCLCLVDLSYLCSPISTGETTERSPDAETAEEPQQAGRQP